MPNGKNSALAGKGDRKVLEKALAWADACLIGRKTLFIHQNTCLIHDQKLIEHRVTHGRNEQPISIIVSQKNIFSENWHFFRQPVERWLLTPCLQQNKNIIPKEFKKIISMDNTWDLTLNKLKDEGLSRIAVLGGAQLATSLLNSDQIDELQLTLTPKIIGGIHNWIPSSAKDMPDTLATKDAWNLSEVTTLSENEIMLRYLRNRKR